MHVVPDILLEAPVGMVPGTWLVAPAFRRACTKPPFAFQTPASGCVCTLGGLCPLRLPDARLRKKVCVHAGGRRGPRAG